jgi:hypothetical protein
MLVADKMPAPLRTTTIVTKTTKKKKKVETNVSIMPPLIQQFLLPPQLV